MASRKRKPFSQIAGDTKNVAPKKPKVIESERRAGTVNSMTLRNFMCHSLLEVNFVNNISFVIGKNGSGKSAILTALIIGLGGKAALTNRGKNVKGFVKAGTQSATIEIVLCNEGFMAYKPTVYGNCIRVVRNLNANGGGSYRIKSEKGEVISTQSKEVNNITLNLNIQVDNPICILNQDTSRNFLSSNDPKSKFSLFAKATKLESLKIEYEKIRNNKNDTITAMNDKTENFRKLQEEIKRLKTKMENHKSILSLKDRKLLLQRELVWSKVRDVEEELENDDEVLKSLERKLEDCKNNSNKRAESLMELNEEFRSLEEKVSEVKAQIEVQKRPQLDLEKRIDELKKVVMSKKNEKQQILTSIQNRTNDIDTLKSDIDSSKENLSKVERQKMERIRNLAELQNKLKGLDDHLETSKNDLFQLKSDLSRKESEEKQLRREMMLIDGKIRDETNNLNALKAESGNNLLLYGREMPRIKELIMEYGKKFEHPPRGPLGCYIKIKDKKWTLAVEGYLGPGLLRAFAVDNKKDNQLLREIFMKILGAGCHPQIITSKFIFNKHDVTGNLVNEPDDCKSVFNALEIDDPVVFNAVIDNCGPENILLIPSDERAQELLSNRNLVPKNCHQGITIKGDKYYPDPNYRSYGSSYRRAQYLQVDVEDRLRHFEENVEILRNKKGAIFKQLEQFKIDTKEKVKQKERLEEKVNKINRARGQIRQRLEEINCTAEPEVRNVQFLEKELEECKKILDKKTAQLERINEEIKEIRLLIKENEADLSRLSDSTKSLEERIEILSEKKRENCLKREEISTGDAFDKRRIKEYENKVKEALSAVTVKRNELKNCTNEALTVGERLLELRRVPAVTNEINDIKHKISRIETDTENIDEILEKYDELTGKFRKSSEIIKGLQKDITELSGAVEKRNRHYKLTESYFVTYMKYSFKKILEYRQFEGNLDINIADKKLELVVIPQHGSQGRTTTSNLSGGERSFSTVAFLYSLWQCMELPFYFLDEFDVYMDKLNRTKVVDILLHHARSKPDLQFVFLTPQDVSFLDGDVMVLKLEDPCRFKE